MGENLSDQKTKVAIAIDIDGVLSYETIDILPKVIAELLKSIKDLAETAGIDLHFFILSNRPLLNVFYEFNIDYFIEDLICSPELHNFFNVPPDPKNFSHTSPDNQIYYIGPNACKTTYGLKEIEEKLNITDTSNIWLIDDNTNILKDAQDNGFTIIRCDNIITCKNFCILTRTVSQIFTDKYIKKSQNLGKYIKVL